MKYLPLSLNVPANSDLTSCNLFVSMKYRMIFLATEEIQALLLPRVMTTYKMMVSVLTFQKSEKTSDDLLDGRCDTQFQIP